MKKKLFTLLIISLLAGMSILTACSVGDGGKNTVPIKLVMSELSYNDTTKIVSWDKVANASGYEIKIGSGSYSIDGVYSNGNKQEYSFSQTQSGTYDVYVIAIGDGRDYETSEPAHKQIVIDDGVGNTETTPSAPQNFSAVAGNGQAILSWSAPTSNGGSAITGYQVSSDNGSTWTTASSNTGHTFTDLTNGTLYTFKVRAVNAKGNGTEATASATPTAAQTTPSAPQNFTATAGDGQVTLSWTVPASNGGSTITAYWVSSDNGATWHEASSSMGHTFTSLSNGNLYTFKVRAVNAVGEGAAATATAMPQSTQPDNALEAPENVHIEFPSTLRWDADIFCVGYRINIDGNIIYTINNKNTTSYLIPSSYNSTHLVSVQAIGDGVDFVDSEFSAPIEYVYGKLAVPANVTVNRSLYTLTFGRVGGTNPAASNVQKYLLCANEEIFIDIPAATTTMITFDLKQLVKIDLYSIKVKTIAIDTPDRDSEWSGFVEYDFDDFASGSGTVSEPYMLANTTHITNITTFNDKYFRLANDIDFAPLPTFSAICTGGNGFAGVFDGNNKKIIGYKFNNLFGNIAANGIVKNLKIDLIDDFSGIYAYAVLAGTNYGTIKNVNLAGNEVVSDNSNFEFEIQALLVGNNAETGIISGCSVTINSLSLINTVGMGFGAIANSNDGTIENSSVNIGIFTISSSRSYTYDYSSETGRYYYIGAIVSQNRGILDFCDAMASVTLSGISGNFYYFGMIAGVNGDKISNSTYGYNGLIQNSYSSGTINASSTSGGEKFIVGGLVALNSKNIKTSFSNVAITANASANKGFSIGGIAGESSDYYSSAYIDCYFAGSINLTNNDTSIAGQIGGFIGRERISGNIYNRCLVVGSINITGSGATSRTQRGAFCGYAQSPSGSDSYYDSETTSGLNAAGGGSASIFAARTTSQMKTASNWTAFGTAWTIAEGQYPLLKLINPKMPIISGATDIDAKINTPVDLLQGVTAVDAESNPIEVKVSDVDFSIAGSVSVTYTATDAEGNTTTITITLKIYGVPEISGADNKSVEISRTGILDPLAGISAVDTFGNPLIVTSNYSSLDLTTTGIKTLIFYATDSMGNTAEISVQLTIYKNPVVTFDPNGGTCATESVTVELGETLSSIPTPTLKGHEFLYWEMPNGEQLDTAISITADMTVVAVWQERNYYVYYNTGTGGNSIPGNSVLYSDLINEILSKTASNSSGFFEGWYFDAGFTQKVTLENFSGTNDYVEVYAKYNSTVKVRFFDIDDSLIQEYDLAYGGNLSSIASDAINTGSSTEGAQILYSFWSYTQGRESFISQYAFDYNVTITAATDFYRVEAYRLTINISGFANTHQIVSGETFAEAFARSSISFYFNETNRWYRDSALTIAFLAEDLNTIPAGDVALYRAESASATVYGANNEHLGYLNGYEDMTVGEALQNNSSMNTLLSSGEWFLDIDRTIPLSLESRMTAGMTIYKQQPVKVTLMEWMGDRFSSSYILEFEKGGTFREGYNAFYNKDFFDQNTWYTDEARTQLFTAEMWDLTYATNFSLYKGDPIYIYVYYYNGTTDILSTSIRVYANETYLEAIQRTYNSYADWYIDADRTTAVTSTILNVVPTVSLEFYRARTFNLTIYDVYSDGSEYQTVAAVTLNSIKENIEFADLESYVLDSFYDNGLSLSDLFTDIDGTNALANGKLIFGMKLYLKESVPVRLVYASSSSILLVRQGETLRQAAARSHILFDQWFVDENRTTLFNSANLDLTVTVPFTLYQVKSYQVIFSTVNLYGGGYDLGINAYEYETLGEAIAKSTAAQNWLASKAGRIYLDLELTQSYSSALLSEYLTEGITLYTPQLFSVSLYDKSNDWIGNIEIYLGETLIQAAARKAENAALLGDITWYLDAFATQAVNNNTAFTSGNNFQQLYEKRDPFTITFDTDGGEPIAPVSLDYGQEYELPVAEKAGYLFLYWTTVKNNPNTRVYGLSSGTSQTLYAYFVPCGDNTQVLGMWYMNYGSGVVYHFKSDNTVERYYVSMYYQQEANNTVKYALSDGLLYCEWFTYPLRLDTSEGYVLVDDSHYYSNCYMLDAVSAVVVIINQSTQSVLGVILSVGSTVGDLEYIFDADFYYNGSPWLVTDTITQEMLGDFIIISVVSRS